MSPEQLHLVAPLAASGLVAALILLRNRRPRRLRPGLMWILPVLVGVGIGLGLVFEPHPIAYGAREYAILAAGLVLGALAGWWRGKGMRLQRTEGGHIQMQASPAGLVLILGIFLVRRAFQASAIGEPGHFSAALLPYTDASLLFAAAMVLFQRLEIILRVRKLPAASAAPTG